MAENKVMEDAETATDAVAQLVADHRRVAALFAQFAHLKAEGSARDKASLVERICRELTVHTTIEEEIFYPAVREAIDDEDLMDEAWVEQAGAKDLVAQLRAAAPEDDLYDAKVTVLGEQIDHHVMEEEGSMFPQAKASGLDTESLGEHMLARRAQLQADPDSTSVPLPTMQSPKSAKLPAKKKVQPVAKKAAKASKKKRR